VVARSRAYRSQETAADLSSAVDRAVHALRRQVRETKTRRARRVVRG
jgi:ribosome-associated translation inhibitor RaiA